MYIWRVIVLCSPQYWGKETCCHGNGYTSVLITGKCYQGCHLWIMTSNMMDQEVVLTSHLPNSPSFLFSARNIVYTALFYSPSSMTVVSASLGSSSVDLLGTKSAGHPPNVVACILFSSSWNEVTVCPHLGFVPLGRVSCMERGKTTPSMVHGIPILSIPCTVYI